MAASEIPCLKMDPEIWWPISAQSASVGLAISLCAACPIEYACLETALDQGQFEGIWGGTTPEQRRHTSNAVLLRLKAHKDPRASVVAS